MFVFIYKQNSCHPSVEQHLLLQRRMKGKCNISSMRTFVIILYKSHKFGWDVARYIWLSDISLGWHHKIELYIKHSTKVKADIQIRTWIGKCDIDMELFLKYFYVKAFFPHQKTKTLPFSWNICFETILLSQLFFLFYFITLHRLKSFSNANFLLKNKLYYINWS